MKPNRAFVLKEIYQMEKTASIKAIYENIFIDCPPSLKSINNNVT